MGALLFAVCGSAAATTFTAEVNDQDGRPVANAVVVLVPDSKASMPAAATRLAAERTIDQRGETFIPLVTIVPKGGHVVFANNDQTTHQVYSFSAVKQFEIPLARGEKSPPIAFDNSGVAEPEMERMVLTFRVLDNPTVGLGPTASPTPRSIESVVDALADGFARKDANAIAETMTPCIGFGAVPGDPDMRSGATFVTSLGPEYAAGTSIHVQSRPIENDQYSGPFVRSTWSKPGEPDQRVDFLLRAQGDRWSVVGVRPRT